MIYNLGRYRVVGRLGGPGIPGLLGLLVRSRVEVPFLWLLCNMLVRRPLCVDCGPCLPDVSAMPRSFLEKCMP